MQEWRVAIAAQGDMATFGGAANAPALPRDDAVATLRMAIEKTLATPSYRRNRRAWRCSPGVDGAANAATEIEALLS